MPFFLEHLPNGAGRRQGLDFAKAKPEMNQGLHGRVLPSPNMAWILLQGQVPVNMNFVGTSTFRASGIQQAKAKETGRKQQPLRRSPLST